MATIDDFRHMTTWFTLGQEPSNTARANRVFGETLQRLGHPAADYYAKADHRAQVNFRHRFQKRTKSNDKGAARRREVWAEFERELTLAKVTEKLEQR